MLQVHGLSKQFGGVRAVSDLSFELREGEILGLIGPNGAGKTTVINLLSGLIAPTSGKISLEGREITATSPEQRVKMGISRTFQMGKPLRGFNVVENVALGAMFGSAGLPLEQATIQAKETLSRLGMDGVLHNEVEDLSVPDRKRLEIARVVTMSPRIMLLDEVMAGLNQTEISQLIALIRELNRAGTTILVVEHVMKAIMSLSHRVLVLHRGQRLAAGLPEEVSSDPEVIRVYLGAAYGASAKKEGDKL